MEKLILEKDREDYYILEVNDKGDTIEFDLTDIGLPERIMNAGDKIIEIGKKYTELEQKILNEFKDDEEKRTRELIKLDKQHATEIRKQFDSFLGEGGCQKIFGDKENIGQYNKLMEALEPHFEKMKIKSEKARQKLANKYIEDKNGVI